MWAAPQVRLPLLDDASIMEDSTDMTRVISRVGIVGIDHKANLGGKGADARIAHRGLGEGGEPGIAGDESDGDAKWRAEFSGVGVGRCLLEGEGLPQAMYGPLGDFADNRLDRLGRYAARGETDRALDIRVSHRTAGEGLEGKRLGYPVLAKSPRQPLVVASGVMGETVEKSVS